MRRPGLVAAVLVAVLAAVLGTAGPAVAQAERFPDGFLWGTATAGFQVEAGGSPPFADRRSDWWAFPRRLRGTRRRRAAA